MATEIALREHLMTRQLSSAFSRNRHNKDHKYAAELGHMLSIAASNPKVANSTPNSLARCLQDVGVLGVSLSPTLKQAYLIPYKISGTLTCTVSISYMGMEQIAYRTGMVVNIQTNIVRKGDKIRIFTTGNRRQVEHEELMDGQRGEVTHVYCIATYKDGSTYVETMDRVQIMACRDAAAKKNDGKIPFTWHPSNPFRYELYKKSCLRRAWKHFPKSESADAKRLYDVVDRMDPMDFEPKEPKKEKKGEASLTITDDQIEKLCKMMGKAGVRTEVHDRWLNGLASHFGFAKYEAIPASRFEEVKTTLASSCQKFKDRKSQGSNNETES